MRYRTEAKSHAATGTASDAAGRGARSAAEARALSELIAWRGRAMADASAPLDAQDLVVLLASCVAELGLDPTVASTFTVNTVHYYRRKDILDPPLGRTAAARYGPRHLWQAIGARLAGHLGLLTLAEARKAMRRARDDSLVAFVAARVVDARSRRAARTPHDRDSDANPPSIRPLGGAKDAVRPLAAAASPPMLAPPAPPPSASPGVVVPLPGGAWCIIPSSHAAHQSAAAAQDLASALAAALRPRRRP